MKPPIHTERLTRRSNDPVFDVDGQEIEYGYNEFAELDRYFKTEIGSTEALDALRAINDRRRRQAD